jgi:hypothetical protein
MDGILKIIFISIIVLTISSCSQKMYPSSEVKFITKTNDDVIKVSSTGYGSREVMAMIDAEKRAFEVILFIGLPNSELRRAIVSNASAAKSKHKLYFDNLFDNQGIRNFITSSSPSLSFTKDKQSGLKRTEAIIEININSLKKDLEKNGIIQKFGL